MARCALALVLLSSVAGIASPALYLVTSSNSGGRNTLRWAINQANANPGADRIKFRLGFRDRVIRLADPLPDIRDNRTTINGDIGSDGDPDIRLDGSRIPGGTGLHVYYADRCTIAGLALTNFDTCIDIERSSECTVRSCHVGVGLRGTTMFLPDAATGIRLLVADHSRIGGPTIAERNVIACGDDTGWTVGIKIERSDSNTIAGNYIGVTRDGSAALGDGWFGIEASGGTSTGNVIGGTTAGDRNVFGGLSTAMRVYYLQDTRVLGNYFGLTAGGWRLLSVANHCIELHDCPSMTIGGTTSGARNVFAGGAAIAIDVFGPNTTGLVIQGNYFGTNARGTSQKSLKTGIRLIPPPSTDPTPAITVGGSTAAAGNWFCPRNPGGYSHGVMLNNSGDGSTIRNNHFGVLPRQRPGTLPLSLTSSAIEVHNVEATIVDNVIERSEIGAWAGGSSARIRVFRNEFRDCERGVALQSDARGGLGDLGNVRTNDDGGNEFVNTTVYHIDNRTPFGVKAEGNNFGTTVAAVIDFRIRDELDDPSYGRVDYIPLIGGILPTGETEPVLAVTAATALPTPTGAQIAFTLSAPATISATVRNLAGRPVRALCRGTECGSGPNTLLWNAQSDSGLPVPNGVYLVEIAAQSADGSQARALTHARIER
jgi:hypothetical protein